MKHPTIFVQALIVSLILCLIGLFFLIKYNRSVVQEGLNETDMYYIDLKKSKIKTYSNQPNNALYTAIIVEPREHKALEYVLKNFLQNLDNHWNILIFSSLDNQEYINKIVTQKLKNDKQRITVIQLNISNMKLQHYNTLFYNLDFYDFIPTDMFLIFQTDTLILKKNKNKIYDFLNYDYVGAPLYNWSGNGVDNICSNRWCVGNGGLSLRNKNTMIHLLNTYKSKGLEKKNPDPYGSYISEDIFFSQIFSNNGRIKVPTPEKAYEFSCEAIMDVNRFHPFGVHKIWIDKNFPQIREKYPELMELEGLNKKTD